jgi:hypothetical protein
MADVEVSGGGTVYLFTPRSKKGRKWVEDNVHLEDWQWLGKGFAVDHRFVADLTSGMKADGLKVE